MMAMANAPTVPPLCPCRATFFDATFHPQPWPLCGCRVGFPIPYPSMCGQALFRIVGLPPLHDADQGRTMQDRLGHLFVVAADITKLHCDAWLLPTTRGADLVGDFARAAHDADLCLPGQWPGGRVYRPEQGDAGPTIWLGDVGRWRGEISWYTECAAEFVTKAAQHLVLAGGDQHRIPLVATPVLGTRFGGADWRAKGELLQRMVEVLAATASSQGVDVALVTWGEDERKALAMYSAAQRARREVLHRQPMAGLWNLGNRQEELEEEARRLATMARQGRLVLFLGAGASAGAALPTWQGLIDGLAHKKGIEGEELERLHHLDLRDQATIVGANDPATRADIAARLRTSLYPLTGALLASLPTREAITTNYDELFEKAVRARAQRLRVLPYEAVTDPEERWVLKMHGSIGSGGEDIILTRKDYLGAPSRQAALFGLVQAMLLTRHLLFVGYSLSDDDFHRLVHEVNHARESVEGTKPQLGTTLVLQQDWLQQRLWSGTLQIVPFDSPGVPAEPSGAARSLQIFLDLVGFLAADLSQFLLDKGFEGLLDDQERRLRDGLRSLQAIEFSDPDLGSKVEFIMRSFGIPA